MATGIEFSVIIFRTVVGVFVEGVEIHWLVHLPEVVIYPHAAKTCCFQVPRFELDKSTPFNCNNTQAYCIIELTHSV